MGSSSSHAADRNEEKAGHQERARLTALGNKWINLGSLEIGAMIESVDEGLTGLIKADLSLKKSQHESLERMLDLVKKVMGNYDREIINRKTRRVKPKGKCASCHSVFSYIETKEISHTESEQRKCCHGVITYYWHTKHMVDSYDCPCKRKEKVIVTTYRKAHFSDYAPPKGTKRI